MKYRKTSRVMRSVWLCAGLLSGIGSTALAESRQSVSVCNPLAYETLRDETLMPLTQALQAGDIAGIRQHLSPSVAKEYQRLFEQNPTYGQFLRDYYDGTTFELVDIVTSGSEHEGQLRVVWPDGRTLQMNLQLGGAGAELKGSGVGSCD